MANKETRIILTGFMGVGKSTVARHAAQFLKVENHDLDDLIEKNERRRIADIIKQDGEAEFRKIETHNLRQILDLGSRIIALGGGAWTIEENRTIIEKHDYTSVWLESTFEHCWRNIRFSRRERSLAASKSKALELFNERQRSYCLADWHFVIRPGFNSYQVAKQISNEIFA